ncbi:MAG: c-type cytochrome [Bacteroidetes bacterium]|nr:c-type cytochrome [Bacteroidota bacterium]
MPLKNCSYKIILSIFVLILSTACNQPGKKPDNTTTTELPDSLKHLPENALKGLVAADDLKLQLFAHEPMLDNPTNIDIDEKGRVWVCEGFNYRNQYNPANPYRKEGDRILILEDTDGDGVADKQTVFYQGTDIDAALGIAVLGNKVIVSRSPNVYVFTDTDGDGKADKKDTLFTSIGGVQHDHAIHSFNFGPDGKLYFNFGNEGHSIHDKNGKSIVDIDGDTVNNSGHPYRQGMVFRCNLDGSEFEVLGNNFRNNYEVAEDAYGTMWQSDNDDDGNRGVRINYVMPHGNYGYTDEMTGASWPERRINMEDSIPYRHWHLNDPGVVPNLLQTGAGSPTGILVYEGDLLPERFRGQIIHADAGPNVVRSYAIAPAGAGYSATINNIVQGKYDNWFRPSDVCVAPDGSLFIADWYDPGVGGHQVVDLTRGRIFRVTTEGHEKYTVPVLDLNSTDGAIKALQSPNLSTRYLAWQKLHGMGEQAIPALENLFHSSNSRFRARALWLLSKIPTKAGKYIDEALNDKDENIRITAIRAALEIHADTLSIVKRLVNDPSWAVRREAVLTLRHNNSPVAADLWASFANQYDGKDRWYLEALGIAADKSWDADFASWMKLVNNQWDTQAGRDIVWRSRGDAAMPLLAKIISNPANDPDKYLKFFRAFDFHSGAEKQSILLSLLEAKHPQQAKMDALVLMLLNPAKTKMTPALKNAIELGLGAVKGTQDFVDIVDRYHIKDKNPELLQIAEQGNNEDLRSNALQALLNSGGEKLLEASIGSKNANAIPLINLMGLVENKKNKDFLEKLILNKSYSAEIKMAALKALGKDWSGEDRLLLLAKNKKLPNELRDSTAAILVASNREEVRKKALEYFPSVALAASNHIEPLDKLMKLEGDATHGQSVFASYCASCHKVNNVGINFGPNLSEIGSKLSKEAIYTAILQPSAGISFGFEGYVFKLKNGTQVLGYILSQTTDEITVKMIGGQSQNIKKSDIVEKKDYGKSLMTEGLSQAMGQQKLVDLVAYLTTLKKKG